MALVRSWSCSAGGVSPGKGKFCKNTTINTWIIKQFLQCLAVILWPNFEKYHITINTFSSRFANMITIAKFVYKENPCSCTMLHCGSTCTLLH